MDHYILEIKNLSFQNSIHYKDIKVIENKVNFIVGASGIGKSTLLKLFNATLTPSNGNILFLGKDLNHYNTIALRKEILLVSQSVYLFDASIKENFEKFYQYREMETPTDKRILEMLSLCCISFPLDKNCSTMSGGERQRIYIAIYLSFLPKIIMLDEPTSALDHQNGQMMMKNILTFCKEKAITMIIVSHDNSLTENFADNIIKIESR